MKCLLLRLECAIDVGGLRRKRQYFQQSVAREKVGAVIGRLDDETMLAVHRALAVFRGLPDDCRKLLREPD